MKRLQLTLGLLLATTIAFGQSGVVDKKPTANNPQKQNTMTTNSTNSAAEFTPVDLNFLKRCLVLAEEALEAGDQPFGSILVNADNEIIAEARNRINEKNVLAHPEIELAEWAMDNLTFEERRKTIMYTTGEHCPMCAGAHSWSQIGSLYYLSSAKQLGLWLSELGVDPAPIEFVPSRDIMKNVIIKGPAKGDLVEEIKQMHERYYKK